MIDEKHLEEFIRQAFKEDVGPGDHTSLACIDADSRSAGRLLVKDTGVISGIEIAQKIFQMVDETHQFQLHIQDGSDVSHGDIAFEVECGTRALLQAERLVLNIMQRMSGISTMSARFAFEVEGTGATVLDTRKTTPLLRFLEKEAVRIGGCTNYRHGLYDRIMIKDNHIAAAGGVDKALNRVRDYQTKNNLNLAITLEVRNLVELETALRIGGADRIMLDNFEIPLLQEAVRMIGNIAETEASGGIDLQNVRKYAETGVQFVSAGALTHSAGTLDMSLKIKRNS